MGGYDWNRPKSRLSERTADGLIPYETRVIRTFCPPIKYAQTGNTYSGADLKIHARPLSDWNVRFGWAHSTEQAFMNVIEMLGEQYEEAASLWQKYEDKLKSFRSVVKNDVSSLEASARAANLAVNKIREAHNKTIEIMNGADMEQAIRNAERLAGALERIQSLKSHKLTLAVLDASPKS